MSGRVMVNQAPDQPKIEEKEGSDPLQKDKERFLGGTIAREKESSTNRESIPAAIEKRKIHFIFREVKSYDFGS